MLGCDVGIGAGGGGGSGGAIEVGGGCCMCAIWKPTKPKLAVSC